MCFMPVIPIEPLTKAAFQSFGDVVEAGAQAPIIINQGFAARVNGLAKIDTQSEGGEVNISLFVAHPRPMPIAIRMMERHPLSSQLFYPLQDGDWLIVVCDDPRRSASYRAFRASGRQGVNYARGVWHHPLLILGSEERFIVVDRAGPGSNLEEAWLDEEQALILGA
jgi:ureidoglycolate lyase